LDECGKCQLFTTESVHWGWLGFIAMSWEFITADFVVLLQVSHVLLAVRLHRVFLLLLPVRWTRTTKYAKKGKTVTQMAGRQAAIAGAGSFTQFVRNGTKNDTR
jgi:hypothetical protein